MYICKCSPLAEAEKTRTLLFSRVIMSWKCSLPMSRLFLKSIAIHFTFKGHCYFQSI